ncbi:MAG: TdeIII family type II restriction endonuclease [Chloroflexota bacterium]
MTEEKKQRVKETLKQSLRKKFQKYQPESKHMPFHYRLLGKDRMALFSFIHSINTTFGTSVYEPVALELARGRYAIVKTQAKPHNEISVVAQQVIQNIIDELISATREPKRETEFNEIKHVCRVAPIKKIKPNLIDVWLEDTDGNKYLIDMKTVKPNVEGFIGHKRKLLEWIAQELVRNPDSRVHSMIGIPYNPYEPKPYNRWTMRGMFDLTKEVLVADELWDFIGGEGTNQDLLDCFEKAGIELRPEIDEHFAKFETIHNI